MFICVDVPPWRISNTETSKITGGATADMVKFAVCSAPFASLSLTRHVTIGWFCFDSEVRQ